MTANNLQIKISWAVIDRPLQQKQVSG